MGKIIEIQALKYPNIPHYEWQGELIKQTEDYVLLLCKKGRKLKHHTKGKIFTINNTSLEYFSLKEWFTAALEIEEGKVTAYYCNIAMPTKQLGNQLKFIDLDLDLLKGKETGWHVVDEDEFEINSIKYGYSSELKKLAIRALDELKRKVEEEEFPFNDNPLEGLGFKKTQA